MTSCPKCGYCPTCGRGGHDYQITTTPGYNCWKCGAWVLWGTYHACSYTTYTIPKWTAPTTVGT